MIKEIRGEPSVAMLTFNLSINRQISEFQANWGYIERPYLKKQNNRNIHGLPCFPGILFARGSSCNCSDVYLSRFCCGLDC